MALLLAAAMAHQASTWPRRQLDKQLITFIVVQLQPRRLSLDLRHLRKSSSCSRCSCRCSNRWPWCNSSCSCFRCLPLWWQLPHPPGPTGVWLSETYLSHRPRRSVQLQQHPLWLSLCHRTVILKMTSHCSKISCWPPQYFDQLL